MKKSKQKTVVPPGQATVQPDPIAAAELDPVQLPENAFRELAANEKYRPMMHPDRDYQEVTPYSVGMGLLLAVIF
ncbi:MAG: hypothetical protein K2F80_02980, partial [Muribaculaceae bacterium]|nr:hypothetical protein [Muribaculaceae bacterium]